MIRTSEISLTCCVAALLTGCGTTTPAAKPSAGPAAQACTAAITGTLYDSSLTHAPVQGGLALLETGSPQVVAGVVTRVVIFTEVSRATSDATGAFRLCVPGPLPPQAVVVMAGVDKAGLAYPPLVAGATGPADRGNIALGGCAIACDPSFSDMVQSAPPAIVEGAVTSTPGARQGTVTAQVGIAPLDGTQTAWSIVVPGLGAGETNQFQTAQQTGPGACAGLCAPYRFTLPTLNPIVQIPSPFTFEGGAPSPGSGQGETQAGGPPLYFIYATAPGCKFPFAGAVFANGEKTFPQATPGAILHMEDAKFTGCQ